MTGCQAEAPKKTFSSPREGISATQKERIVEQTTYDAEFEKNFARLHRVVEAETKARRAQCERDVAINGEVYRRIHLREDDLEQDVKNVYKDLQVDIKVEEDVRVQTQIDVVNEANDFLDQLKGNIEQDIIKQREGNADRRKKMKENRAGLE